MPRHRLVPDFPEVQDHAEQVEPREPAPAGPFLSGGAGEGTGHPDAVQDSRQTAVGVEAGLDQEKAAADRQAGDGENHPEPAPQVGLEQEPKHHQRDPVP